MARCNTGAPLDLDVHVSEHYGSEQPVVQVSKHSLSYELLYELANGPVLRSRFLVVLDHGV